MSRGYWNRKRISRQSQCALIWSLHGPVCLIVVAEDAEAKDNPLPASAVCSLQSRHGLPQCVTLAEVGACPSRTRCVVGLLEEVTTCCSWLVPGPVRDRVRVAVSGRVGKCHGGCRRRYVVHSSTVQRVMHSPTFHGRLLLCLFSPRSRWPSGAMRRMELEP
jgi:hypothetical protein